MENAGLWAAAWSACGLLVASVVYDLRVRRIPNAILVLLLGLFAVYAASGATEPVAVLWGHLAVGAVLLATGFALYLTRRFGAGDGKLLAVCGLWVGPTDLSLYLFGLGAGALSLSMFALLPFERARRMRAELPFAVAIAPPTIVLLFRRTVTHWIQ